MLEGVVVFSPLLSGVGGGELMEGDKKRKGSECFVLDNTKNKI